MKLDIQRLKGKQIVGVLDDLARLRQTVFREYPYLYDGSIEYEKKYLNTYIESEESVFVVVRYAGEIIGVSTAIPLEFESPECQKPFLEHQLRLSDIFYFGESVLLPAYRNRGVYRHFFDNREKAAQDYGSKIAAFCSVVRDKNDKRRPLHYSPLDAVWNHFGYEKHSKMITHYEWKEIDAIESTFKPMVFWMKKL